MTERQRVVVIRNLRVDRRQLVDLELDLVAVPERPRRDARQVERSARREEERRARGAGEDSTRGRFWAAACARCVVLGAAFYPRAAAAARVEGAGSSLNLGGGLTRDAQALALRRAARRLYEPSESCAAPAVCGQIRPARRPP